MKRRITAAACVLLCLILSLPCAAQGTAATDTFAHRTTAGGKKKTVALPAVYTVGRTVTARSLGLDGELGEIRDIGSDEKENIYILTGDGQILVLDPSLGSARCLTVRDAAGAEMDISGAKGLYICSETELYIADTENARVLHCIDGTVTQEILLPDSPLIPDDLVYKPVRLVRDREGCLYVLSEGCYHGAITIDPDGGFAGFYGANTVKGSVLSALGYLWDRLTMNDQKRAQVSKTLPYQFSDICIDAQGFMYTCTGQSADDPTGQIRMLSPGGDGIMPGAESRDFGESDLVERLDKVLRQDFIGICTDGNGLIYALDGTFGLIYIYDTAGEMIAAFGGGIGQGRREGTFVDASAITLCGTRLLVADAGRGGVTEYVRTPFGDTLCRAQELTLQSEYEQARPLWEQVLQYDPADRLAQQGLAKAAFRDGDYTQAMSLAKACGDADIYSQARTKVQDAFITGHFGWLFLAAVAVLGGLAALLIAAKKRQLVLVRDPRLRVLLRAPVHPFASFAEIREKHLGSVRIAAVLTVLFFLTSAAATILSDFRYTNYDVDSYSSLFQIVQTVGLIGIWSVANWAVSTLQEGKGRLPEVFTVSAYSILPMIVYNVISIPLTHLAASSGSALIAGLHTLALIFSGILLTVGLMTIHEFSFPRFFVTALLSVLAILLIIFVLFMLGILLTQFVGFFGEIVLEGVRRFT